jgi:HK97 family phage portal protein
MNASTHWYNAERVSQPGSTILQGWMAQRQAERAQAAAVPARQVSAGSDMFDVLTGGLGTAAGMAVTEASAMAVSAVYACVALIGGAVASMPFHQYKRTKDGRERYENDLWWLFNEQPFNNWTAASAWSFATQSIGLRGDGFWRIHRASPYSNTIVGFEPMHPSRVGTLREAGRNYYPVVKDDGSMETVDQDDMLHFPGVGFDGLRSLTPIRSALRQSAGIALAADEYSAAFFANGARPDFAITASGTVTKDQADLLRSTWAKRHTGASNAHLPAVLAGGLDVKQLTMSAEDAQLLSTRSFQVLDVARIFGVPPHMIGHTEKTTSWGTGVEQMSIGFVRYTVGRYLDAMSQEINRKVWPKSRSVYGEHNRDALLEGDAAAQAAYFSKALGGPGTQGWMLINEVRRMKNLPPIDGGNQLVKAGAATATNAADAADASDAADATNDNTEPL